MTNSLLRSDYISAIKSVVSLYPTWAPTLAELERKVFLFRDPNNPEIILHNRIDNEVSHVLLNDDEKCVYKVIDGGEYDVMQTLRFTDVKMGELTELGFIPVSNGGMGTLIFKAENDTSPASGFVDGGVSFTFDDAGEWINTLKFFGNKIYFKYTPQDEMDSGLIIVYAKYKPHSLSFDVQSPLGTSYLYLMPCVGSGYDLVNAELHLTASGDSSSTPFHFYKKAAGDVFNDTRVFQLSSGNRSWEKIFSHEPEGNTRSHYSDIYFGGNGTVSSRSYIPFEMRMTFELMS